ncbi:endonuclease domain-containing protein [Microbacterium caowuchunii]|uniref:DUF559 domain-containing protein n=1 Tax=Microbacterium caowuchunii TaxID=2614638 RepID=A0A5N0TLX0_9MICO|nr:DUF559 domain-containing protein [Microbacterium caowuchunii]KAA9135378.1 DUF559 domain-containing protein [Microbacterium caowuchunii]
MSIRSLLHPLGFLHRADLLDLGWSAERIRSATADEGCTLLRRQWIVAPEAPAIVRSAAAAGARVTCVTATSLQGVWRPGHDDTGHVRLPPHSSGRCEGARVHRSLETVAPHPRSLIDRLENALAAVADCLGYEDALAVWESAVRIDLVSREHLMAVPWRGPRARRLAADVGDQSDSGLETLGLVRLARAGVRMRQQVRILGHRVDGLIGTRLVLQFDGFAHHRASDRRRDIAHDRRLRLSGYTVLRFDYHEVVNDWPRVEREILAAVAQGLHHRPRLP